MNKTITVTGVIVALPVIMGISFLMSKDNASVQTFPIETSSITIDTDYENTTLLTDNIR